MKKSISILGTRGVPAKHGGFETFAEYLSLYLSSRGWDVVVYCQEDGSGAVSSDVWRNVHRVIIPVKQIGSLGTIIFDLKATFHAAKSGNLCLTLGYNTAIFCALLRLKSVPNIINMDGIEWRREKWGKLAKTWFWMNDWLGCWLGNHLVADHPKIKKHLSTRVSEEKITMIPYGAPHISSADDSAVKALGLDPNEYLTLIARPEPENSILEVVQGFSMRPRGVKLAVLGNFSDDHAYHRRVKDVAGDEVVFLGAIYDKAIVQALRFHSLAYVHGHQVGGTNPSLVEALGAGNAVLAHDNQFNHWVAGPGARYFSSAESFDSLLTEFLSDSSLRPLMQEASTKQFQAKFTWDQVLRQYEELLESWIK